jgi:CheY-like chemotaxis protein
MIGLLLCDDLTWLSRISSTAQVLGYKVKSMRTLAKLVALAEQEAPACVILDLDAAGANPAEVASRMEEIGCPARRVAFGAHVDVASLEEARAAGFDPVLTRGQMAAHLHRLLAEWLQAPPASDA